MVTAGRRMRGGLPQRVVLPLLIALTCATDSSDDRALASASNPREEILQAWAAGVISWEALCEAMTADGEDLSEKAGRAPAGGELPATGPVSAGYVRLLRFGGLPAEMSTAAMNAAAAGGVLRLRHRLENLGGVEVLEADPAGLRAVLAVPGRRLMLDRDGRPAVDRGRVLSALPPAQSGLWQVAGDWSSTVAILDSGCDTAHDDLGDFSRDNADGPPPAVGDALDWSDASLGWPLFTEYKVVGWHDVTDDFPGAAGPWDYHYHGTALAGVVAGAGEVAAQYRGLASSGRLAVVKFYDFDGIWRQWAGDFLAACDWVLANREVYRVRVVLCAVNWEIDAGISEAMNALVTAGILPVAAMGNDGLTDGAPGYPARLPSVLTVGAVDDAGRLAAYSSRGRLDSGKPDLVAPGGGWAPASGRITTTDNEPNDSYSPRRGTSLAAAHVAAGAQLLLEAMRKEGYAPPRNGADVQRLRALLVQSAAPVLSGETPTGETYPLVWTAAEADSLRGWGLLQVAAAVESFLHPLPAGGSATDSLGGTDGRRVMARRLVALPNRSCQVEAIPEPGLDVRLEWHDLRRLTDPTSGLPPRVSDRGGRGVTESMSCRMPDGAVVGLTVKHLSGRGRVTLRVTEPVVGGAAPAVVQLTGSLTGWPTGGTLHAGEGASVVFSGLVDLDPQARVIQARDLQGQLRAGWPVFVFLSGGQGGNLSSPLVWDLDGQPGDEIVVGSGFGRAYFLSGTGTVQPVDLAPAGVSLTSPVGRMTAAGQREVVLVTQAGTMVRCRAGGVVVGTTALGATSPLAPAVGELDGQPGDEVVVAFSGGRVTAAGEGGQTLAGWPRDLGVSGLHPPVLVDLDGDGRHEVILTQHTTLAPERVVFRVFRGDGTAAQGDGQIAQAPAGGRWLARSWLAAWRPEAGGGPRLALQGLVADGPMPDSLQWRLAEVTFAPGGVITVAFQAAFRVAGSSPSSSLLTRWTQLVPPLAWDYRGGPGLEPAYFAALGWEETVPGNPSQLGAMTAWFPPAGLTRSADDRLPLWPGGPLAASLTAAGAVLLPATDAGGLWVCCQLQGRRLVLQPAGRPSVPGDAWSAARADGRNSGALPFAPPPPTGIDGVSGGDSRLEVWPNPGSGGFRLAWRGVPVGKARIELFDLRGRRVRSLFVGELADEGALSWDGLDGDGHAVAAGAYFMVLRHAGGVLRGRIVVAR